MNNQNPNEIASLDDAISSLRQKRSELNDLVDSLTSKLENGSSNNNISSSSLNNSKSKETKMVQNIIVVPLLNVIFQKLLYYSQEEVKVLGIKNCRALCGRERRHTLVIRVLGF